MSIEYSSKKKTIGNGLKNVSDSVEVRLEASLPDPNHTNRIRLRTIHYTNSTVCTGTVQHVQNLKTPASLQFVLNNFGFGTLFNISSLLPVQSVKKFIGKIQT